MSVRPYVRPSVHKKFLSLYLTPPLMGFPLEFCIGAGVSEN